MRLMATITHRSVRIKNVFFYNEVYTIMKQNNYPVSVVCLISLCTAASLVCKEADYTSSSHTALRKAYVANIAPILEARFDLHACDEEKIRDIIALEAYLSKMCILLRVTDWSDSRFITSEGPLITSSSGSVFVQLSGGVCIMGRVIHETNSVQITISAPSGYDPHELAQFSKRFFGAEKIESRVVIRK